jgi:hypothetical protein
MIILISVSVAAVFEEEEVIPLSALFLTSFNETLSTAYVILNLEYMYGRCLDLFLPTDII